MLELRKNDDDDGGSELTLLVELEGEYITNNMPLITFATLNPIVNVHFFFFFFFLDTK